MLEAYAPEVVERCVKKLMADPKFKPRDPKQTKREAAWAVCTAQHEKKKLSKADMEWFKLLNIVRKLNG